MAWDSGDFLVLIITILIFAIYWQLDKKNKSLEKIKKFTDKVRGELDLFMGDKVQEVKDLAIDLEIHQKTGKEILKRIKTIEDSLNERADVIENMHTRIGEYDKALNTLNGMSERVDENLKRLREESVFVDTVAKRLKDAGQKMTKLEKDLPGLRDEFVKINNQALTEVSAGITKQSGEMITALDNKIAGLGKQVGAFNESVVEIENRRDELAVKTQEKITAIFNDTLGDAKASGKEIAEALSSQLDRSLATARHKGDEIAQEIQGSITKAGNELQQIQGTHSEKVDQFVQAYKNIETDYQGRLKTLITRAGDFEDETYTALADYIEQKNMDLKQNLTSSIQQMNNDFTTSKAGLTELFEDTRGDFDSWKGNLYREMEIGKQDITGFIGEIKNNFEEVSTYSESRIAQIDESLTEAEENWKIRADELGEHSKYVTDSLKQQFGAQLSNKKQEIDDLLEAELNTLKDTLKSVELLREERAKYIEDEITALDTRVGMVSREVYAKMEETKAVTQAGFEDIQQKSLLMAQENEQTLKDSLTSVELLQEERAKYIENKITDLDTKVGLVSKEVYAKIEETKTVTQAGFEDIQQKSLLMIQENEQTLNERVAAQNEVIAARSEELDNRLEHIKQLGEEISVQGAAIKDKLNQDVAALEEKITSFTQSATERLSKSAEDVELKVMKDLETSLKDYEGELSHRLEKVEQVVKDVELLEKNLRQAMEQMTGRVEKDFQDFGIQMEEKRSDEQNKFSQTVTAIREEVDALEHGLAELKTRAYDNVSEKLQVFEDEFFTDLKKRNADMHQKLSNWQDNIQENLDEMAQQNTLAREEVEHRYSESLKHKISEIREESFEKLTNFEKQVETFQASIKLQMDNSGVMVEEFKTTIKTDIDAAKTASSDLFKQEFNQHNSLVNEHIKKFEKDIEGRVGALTSKLDNNQTELTSMLDSSRSEIKVWQAKILQQMKEAEADITDQYTTFRSEALETIGGIKEEFISQRDDLIVSTHEERLQLKTEIQTMSEKVASLEEELRKRTEQSLENFQREYDTFLLEFQKKTRDLQHEADQRIKDFRSAVQDTREKVDSLQKKMFGKIEENYNILSVNLGEIDNKQKNFISQTKLFERADSLKQGLEEDIEEIKTEIAKVDLQRKELKEVENVFLRVKKMNDDVQTKMTKFSSEKRKLETMEEDFNRIMSLSQTIDIKLKEITESDDQLQKVQVKLKEIEDVEKEAAARFDRLEKKNIILDSTIDRIDRNFETIESLEGTLKGLENDINPLPGKVVDFQEKLQQLLKSNSKVEKMIEKVSGLDSTLQDVEDRTKKLDVVREWLARTETRFEEVKKQAEDEIKLLGNIVREGQNKRPSNNKGADRGAPDLDIRETVTRLAHQKWSVEEIASATGISRGEVELILEIGLQR